MIANVKEIHNNTNNNVDKPLFSQHCFNAFSEPPQNN